MGQWHLGKDGGLKAGQGQGQSVWHGCFHHLWGLELTGIPQLIAQKQEMFSAWDREQDLSYPSAFPHSTCPAPAPQLTPLPSPAPPQPGGPYGSHLLCCAEGKRSFSPSGPLFSGSRGLFLGSSQGASCLQLGPFPSWASPRQVLSREEPCLQCPAPWRRRIPRRLPDLLLIPTARPIKLLLN